MRSGPRGSSAAAHGRAASRRRILKRDVEGLDHLVRRPHPPSYPRARGRERGGGRLQRRDRLHGVSVGAVLVDLHAAGLAARQNGTETSLVSSNGFHPSDGGRALVAKVSATAYAAK